MGVKNALAVPTVIKISINMGIGANKGDKEYKLSAIEELKEITGQAPVIRKSQKPISGFKLRKGEDIGLTVTLRGNKMWDFLDNLVSIVLPRVRDFRGVSKKSFDGGGNYSIGIKEHIVFPTLNYSKVTKLKGLQITICTNAKDDEKAYILLKSLGMPFRD